ncbi:MAG TPA: acetate--CoA ligase [Candidatus Pacearchaeota archaeon]|nr:acetate--CoA ligase [Candidatus Pacearchaeota archaeon]HPZ74788.1 acetate--CoA ligase [Candidatus Pacearchaeota archaeon]
MKFIKKGNLYYPPEDFKKQSLVKSKEIYKKAADDPILFWENAAKELDWYKKWEKAFYFQPPYLQWFLGGKINLAQNALDRHLKINKDKVALIWEPEPIEEKPQIFTYNDLYQKVNQLANSLKRIGIKKGDRVAIYMPMIPEAIISMLACARIGAVHIVIFSAFSPDALKIRLEISGAKVLITADGYYRRGKIIPLKINADEGAKGTLIEKVIVAKRLGNKIPFNKEKDLYFDELIKNESTECEPEILDSEDPFFILPESGTTGQFLPILHTVGGYTVQAHLSGKLIFDFQKDSVLWCTSDIGWVTGHTYTVYAPLLNGISTVIFEGAPDWPTPDRWAQIIEKNKVSVFYTAPTAIRMFKKLDKKVLQQYQFKNLRVLGSVGEPMDEATWLWYFENIGKERCPIVDTYWQTETGGIVISSLPGVGPFRPGFCGLPFPGIKVDILDNKGKSCLVGERGNLVVLPPFSPGFLRGIYNDEQKYVETYWNQYGKEIYFTSDGAVRDENGLIKITGRIDDVMKISGHRLSTNDLESVILKHSDIIETAVIGVPDEVKGEVPVAFVILKNKRKVDEIKKEVIDITREKIGPIATPKYIFVVKDLPKTKSGKIMRGLLKKIIMGEDLGDISALSNPESLKHIQKQINTDNQLG